MAENPYTAIARLLRPQGRKGEILADMLTDFPERFKNTPTALLENPLGEPSPVVLEDHWFPMGKNAGRIVLKLAGVDSINAAEAFNGKLLLVPDEDRVPIGDDRVWTSDLIGCTVYHHENLIGEVADLQFPTDSQGIRHEHAVPLLVLHRPNSEDELLIPFAKAYILTIDVPQKRIEMTLPDGLLEING